MKRIEVVAAIIYQDKTIFAAERGPGFLEGYFEFPGGKVEEGETQQEALARELYEELGIESEIKEYELTVEHQYENFYLVMHLYNVQLKSENIQLKFHKSYRWLTKELLLSVNWAPADIPVLKYVEVKL